MTIKSTIRLLAYQNGFKLKLSFTSLITQITLTYMFDYNKSKRTNKPENH